MSGKEQFVKLPRELLESAAWQSQSINCRRFIDFLMLEHMRRGGRQNGRLIAPRRQLCAFGINNGDRVTEAINEAERRGLVLIQRGSRRRANTYGLAWLKLHDGTVPEARWHEHRDEPQVMRDKPPLKVRDKPPSKGPDMRDKPPSIPPNHVGTNRPHSIEVLTSAAATLRTAKGRIVFERLRLRLRLLMLDSSPCPLKSR